MSKLEEMASEYSFKGEYDSNYVDNEMMDAFIAGAKWERERSKKLLEALILLSNHADWCDGCSCMDGIGIMRETLEEYGVTE